MSRSKQQPQFSEIPYYKVKGTLQSVGQQYGKLFSRAMDGFFTAEIGEQKVPQSLIDESYECINEYTPSVRSFLRGVAKTSALKRDSLVKLLLHEELYHLKWAREQQVVAKRKISKKKNQFAKRPQYRAVGHCTAVAFAGDEYVRGGGSLIGQNWDWGTEVLPWASFVEYSLPKQKVLAYQYPGLPICAGVNSSGLGLVWTGAGYYPAIEPKAGVPTYALVFEILQRSSTEEALEFLYDTPIAGPFIFIIGDCGGSCSVVEATSDFLSVTKVESMDYRANYFCDEATQISSRQKLPGEKQCNSKIRMRTLQSFARKLRGKANVLTLQRALSQKGVFVDFKPSHLSLDQIVVDCKAGALITRRGTADTRWSRHQIS